MAERNYLTDAFLERVRQRSDGDTYGTRALRELVDRTAQYVEERKMAGKPSDSRSVRAMMVAACRESFFAVNELLRVVPRGAPGRDEAEEELLAAKGVLWPLFDVVHGG